MSKFVVSPIFERGIIAIGMIWMAAVVLVYLSNTEPIPQFTGWTLRPSFHPFDRAEGPTPIRHEHVSIEE